MVKCNSAPRRVWWQHSIHVAAFLAEAAPRGDCSAAGYRAGVLSRWSRYHSSVSQDHPWLGQCCMGSGC